MTDSLALSLISGAGVVVQSTTIPIQINPSVLTCGVTFPNTTVDAVNDYTITVTPNSNVPLPNTGSLDLVFPSQWQSSETGPALTYSSCSGTVSCSVSGSTVTASNLFAAATTTSSFSFVLSSVTNPGSLQPNE